VYRRLLANEKNICKYLHVFFFIEIDFIRIRLKFLLLLRIL